MTNEHALTVVQPSERASVILWGTDDPVGMVDRMRLIATALADAVRGAHMTVKFRVRQTDHETGEVVEVDREYVLAEGWAMVGAMVGAFAHTQTLDEILEGDTLVGFKAQTHLVTKGGEVVGGAYAIVTKDEQRWAGRDWNQVASMAQTRAAAKAYRQVFGFIMPLAGLESTPAEEMEGIHDERQAAAQPARQTPPPQARSAAPASGQPGERFQNVGQLLMRALTEHKMSAADVMRVAGLEPSAQRRELGNYPGGLAALWERIRASATGQGAAQPPAAQASGQSGGSGSATSGEDGNQEPTREADGDTRDTDAVEAQSRPAPDGQQAAQQAAFVAPAERWPRAARLLTTIVDETELPSSEAMRLFGVADLAALEAQLEGGLDEEQALTLARMAAASDASDDGAGDYEAPLGVAAQQASP